MRLEYCPKLNVLRSVTAIRPPAGLGGAIPLDCSRPLWTATVLETCADRELFVPSRNNASLSPFLSLCNMMFPNGIVTSRYRIAVCGFGFGVRAYCVERMQFRD